jgi:hypothetical protein
MDVQHLDGHRRIEGHVDVVDNPVVAAQSVRSSRLKPRRAI